MRTRRLGEDRKDLCFKNKQDGSVGRALAVLCEDRSLDPSTQVKIQETAMCAEPQCCEVETGGGLRACWIPASRFLSQGNKAE